LAERLDRTTPGRLLVLAVEDPAKSLLLSCQRCGDCAIQHLAFLCPESKCPKHLRNGACGGSRNRRCEVYPDRNCVWVRVYERWACVGQTSRMAEACVPPRNWALNRTSSWLNFLLRRDHQSAGREISQFCARGQCPLDGCDCQPPCT